MGSWIYQNNFYSFWILSHSQKDLSYSHIFHRWNKPFLNTLTPSSSSTCKELGSKKLSKLKNQQVLDLSGKWGHKSNHCPQNWRDRQADSETQNSPEQNLTSRTPWMKQCWGRNTSTVIDLIARGTVWTILRVKNSRGIHL